MKNAKCLLDFTLDADADLLSFAIMLFRFAFGRAPQIARFRHPTASALPCSLACVAAVPLCACEACSADQVWSGYALVLLTLCLLVLCPLRLHAVTEETRERVGQAMRVLGGTP